MHIYYYAHNNKILLVIEEYRLIYKKIFSLIFVAHPKLYYNPLVILQILKRK